MKTSGWTLACIGIIVCYSLLVVVLSDQLPKYDDLNDVFGFFIEYNKAESLPKKIQSFFYPNNEHVIAVNHLIYWLQLQLNNKLDFQQLNWIGNGFIIGTALLATKLIQPAPRHLAFFIICGYLSLNYWDSSFKAMTAISNQAVIFFALLSLLCAEKKHWGMAIIAAAASHYSQFNGIFIWPLLLMSFGRPRKNNYHQGITIILAASFCTWFYFFSSHDYRSAQEALSGHANPISNLSALFIAKFLLDNIWLATHAFINFIGNSWLPNQYPYAITIWGGIIFALFCYITLFQNHTLRLKKPLLLVFVFLLLSMASITVSRAIAFGDPMAVSASRYKMYSILFVVLTLACLVKNKRHIVWPWLLSTISLLAFISAIPSAAISIKQQTLNISNSLQYWLIDGDLRRAEALHIPLADFFFFHAEYLDIWDPYQSANVDVLHLHPTQQSCAAVTTLPYCSFLVLHRLNAISAQVIAPNQLPQGSQLQFCSSSDANYLSLPISEHQRQATRLFIDRARLSHHYQYAILLKNNTSLCQTPLNWSERKREEEIKNNLGD